MLNTAFASDVSCVVGWWPKYLGATPAATCEIASNDATWEGKHGVTRVFNAVVSPSHKSYLDYSCLVSKDYATIDTYIAKLTAGESIEGNDVWAVGYGSCSCWPLGIKIYTNAHGTEAGCGDNALQLSLTPAPNQTPPNPRPKGTEGKDPKSSTHELIAKVTENGNPKAGVAVSFGVEVEANSGGHDHHDASRPKGEVKANSLTTDAKGEIKVTFQASQIAGKHVVAAVCSSCTNTSVTKNVDVKVPDLIPMQADSSVPPRYELAGNTSPVGVKHKGNHYFTASAKAYLLNLIDHYNSFAWQPVAVNDASIIWGGWFDIYSNWAGSHAEHRIGEEVDLGFLVGTNASKIKRGYDEVCKDKKVEIPSTILWHDIPKPAGKYDPHFHVRLSGSYTKGPSAGKYAPCESDSGTK